MVGGQKEEQRRYVGAGAHNDNSGDDLGFRWTSLLENLNQPMFYF